MADGVWIAAIIFKGPAQWNGERQYPLAHRHARDDVIDQVSGGLCHAPCAATGAKTSFFTNEITIKVKPTIAS